MGTKYYSQEIVVCVWKDSNPLGLPFLGKKRTGHASIKVKDQNDLKESKLDETKLTPKEKQEYYAKRYLSWMDHVEAGPKGGQRIYGYKRDIKDLMKWEVQNKLIQYSKRSIVPNKYGEEYSKAGITALIQNYHNQIKKINQKFCQDVNLARQKYSHSKNEFQTEYNRLLKAKKLQIDKYKDEIDENNDMLEKASKTWTPRHNQKLKTYGNDIHYGVVPDYKVYLPVKGAKRLSDGKRIRYGLNYKSMQHWLGKFDSTTEKYDLYSRNHNCSGTVLRALEAGGSTKTVWRPLISSPTTVLQYALKLKKEYDRLNRTFSKNNPGYVEDEVLANTRNFNGQKSKIIKIDEPILKDYLSISSTLLGVERIIKTPAKYNPKQIHSARQIYELFILPLIAAYRITGSYNLHYDLRVLLNKVEKYLTKRKGMLYSKHINNLFHELQNYARTKMARSEGDRKKFGKAVLMLTWAPMGIFKKTFKVKTIFDYINFKPSFIQQVKELKQKFRYNNEQLIFELTPKMKKVAATKLRDIHKHIDILENDKWQIENTVELQSHTRPMVLGELYNLMYIQRETKYKHELVPLSKQEAILSTILRYENNKIPRHAMFRTLFYAIL